MIQPFFDRVKEEALVEFKRLAGTGQTSNDIHEIVAHSFTGKIDVLFVALGQELWGTFDPDASKVDLHESAKSCYVDLSDLAAAYTLLHKGTVYVLKPEQMPGESSVAAIFRQL